MLDNSKARAVAAHVVNPIAQKLLDLGVKPNHVTVFTASVSSLIVILTWTQGNFWLGFLLSLPFVFGDLLDGTMARLSGTESRFGSFLDSVLDRITDATIFGSLVYYFASVGDTVSAALATWALATAIIISYIRAKADAVGVDCKVGIMERSERLAVLALAVISLQFGYEPAMSVAALVLAVMNSVTVFQRLKHVSRELHEQI
jgi:CDP-diacylglycerol---glycerol-3-phosphate 3-phosphatidyltransferase